MVFFLIIFPHPTRSSIFFMIDYFIYINNAIFYYMIGAKPLYWWFRSIIFFTNIYNKPIIKE